MGLAENFRMMAKYNQRMNVHLLEVCKQLSPEQLHEETNSFFSSVMCHWNHILFGDLIMLGRLIKNGLVQIEPSILEKLPVATSVNDKFANTLEELVLLRAIVDDVYVKAAQRLTSESCEQTISYKTSEGVALEKTVAEFFQHIFNHQTHHRGQLTCILSQFGLDYGCTDLPMIVPEGART